MVLTYWRFRLDQPVNVPRAGFPRHALANIMYDHRVIRAFVDDVSTRASLPGRFPRFVLRQYGRAQALRLRGLDDAHPHSLSLVRLLEDLEGVALELGRHELVSSFEVPGLATNAYLALSTLDGRSLDPAKLRRDKQELKRTVAAARAFANKVAAHADRRVIEGRMERPSWRSDDIEASFPALDRLTHRYEALLTGSARSITDIGKPEQAWEDFRAEL